MPVPRSYDCFSASQNTCCNGICTLLSCSPSYRKGEQYTPWTLFLAFKCMQVAQNVDSSPIYALFKATWKIWAFAVRLRSGCKHNACSLLSCFSFCQKFKKQCLWVSFLTSEHTRSTRHVDFPVFSFSSQRPNGSWLFCSRNKPKVRYQWLLLSGFFFVKKSRANFHGTRLLRLEVPRSRIMWIQPSLCPQRVVT
jgi:hypothetical protein